MNWYIDALKKYAVFSGRARRKKYWYLALFNIIITFVLAAFDAVTGSFSKEAGIGLMDSIYDLAILIPSIAVTVRHLHDTGRSGWWMLIGLIPLIDAIVLLVFTVQDSKSGQNQYSWTRTC